MWMCIIRGMNLSAEIKALVTKQTTLRSALNLVTAQLRGHSAGLRESRHGPPAGPVGGATDPGGARNPADAVPRQAQAGQFVAGG